MSAVPTVRKERDGDLSAAIEMLADQLFATLDDNFNLRITTENVPPSVQKLGMLVNHILDKARHMFDERDECNRLLDTKVQTRTFELTAALRQLQEASEAKSIFLATMSHELRTPLNAIIGYSEMLIEDAEAEEQEERSQDLNRILRSSHHLLSLINDVLDLSKIEAGKVDLSVSIATFEDVIADVTENLRPQIEANGNTLIVEIENPRAQIHTDVRRLEQCLLNLGGNAAKFTRDGTVTITAKAMEQDVVISVSDTGIGMTGAQMSRIFAAFTQADGGTARKYGGSGLGLTITRELTHILGGEVSVRSSPGAGSTFTLTIKRYLGPIGRRRVPKAEHPVIKGDLDTRGPILVIDNDPRVCEAILSHCRKLGLAAVCAFDGATAVTAAQALHPAAVILDLKLADTSGWEVLALLRRDNALSGLPILAMTSDEEPLNGVTPRVDELLPKPVKPWQLTRFLKSHVMRNGYEPGQLQ